MNELTANINWLGVGVGAIVSFALGWLWYSPKLFGVKWAAGVGVKFEQNTTPPAMAMIFQALGTFLLAWVVGITAASNALLTITLIVLTIVVLMVAGGLFSKKSSYAIATEVGFVVAMTVVMIVCQGLL